MFKIYNNTYTSPHTHLFCKTNHVNILFKGMLGNVNSKYCKVYILKPNQRSSITVGKHVQYTTGASFPALKLRQKVSVVKTHSFLKNRSLFLSIYMTLYI